MSAYETVINSLYEVKDWGRLETLQEVLKWLDEITIDDADGCGHPIVSFTYFESKEEMLQSFKERFNIE